MTTAQRETDLADARRLGFSHLTADAQRRIMEGDPLQVLDLLADNPKYRAGDVVGLNDAKFTGRRWEVKRVNPTTYTLDPVGGGRGVRAPFDMVCAAPGTDPEPGPPVLGKPYVPVTLMSPGALVRYTGTRSISGVTPGSIAVVIADRGADRVTVAKLGGVPSGACLRANRANLTVVDPAEVLRAA
jgi:hypothetical protein